MDSARRTPATAHVDPGHVNGTAPKADVDLKHGSVLIAAITSCTNTSNPSVMIAAGLLAKKAVERGLKVNAAVKTSLAPGSRVVTDYFEKTGLDALSRPARFPDRRLRLHHLHRQFRPAHPGHRRSHHQERSRRRQRALRQPQFRGARASQHQGELPHVAAARRRLRARGQGRHRSRTEPLGTDKDGKPVYLKEIWPTNGRKSRRSRRRVRHARRLPQELRQLRRAESGLEQHPRLDRRDLRLGTRRAPTSRSRPSSRISPWSPATSPRSSMRVRSASSATPSRPTTSRPPAASRRVRPPAPTSSSTASPRRNSTATARAAATIAS